MGTVLSFLSGRQITDDNGTPQSGAKLLHYLEDTVSDLTVYQNSAGSTPHAQPVVCDSGGFVPLIYVDDTSDWKVVITDADDVELQTYNNLDKGPTNESSVGFAPPLFEWTQVTNAASPVSLAASDAGKAYEADTTSGSIEFDLPSAASVGNGKGFLFKKTNSANSLIIDQNGSETIDDFSTAYTITAKDEVVGIFSNGAEYYKVIYTGTPTGGILAWPTATAPNGYLECDGSAISRTIFAALFGIIGVTYGNGDGSTTFNLPDLRGEFIRGFDNGAGNDADAASRTDRGDGTTGDNVGTKQTDAIRNITGQLNDVVGDAFSASATGAFSDSSTVTNVSAGTGSASRNGFQPVDFDASNASGVQTGSDNRPRNVAMMWVIKT